MFRPKICTIYCKLSLRWQWLEKLLTLISFTVLRLICSRYDQTLEHQQIQIHVKTFSFLHKVGFINVITKDNCYKIVRDLLVNITSKHTELISSLLFLLKENFKSVDKYGTYLFKSLPLEVWRPSIDIFEICAKWLLQFGFETRESAMARTIFSRLNWNFDKATGELFLPYEIHVRMASLIVEVSSKHVPGT